MTVNFSYQSPYSEQPYQLQAQFSKYKCGQHAIQLIDLEDGMPYATASVRMPDITINHDEVCIKNWSENEGLMEAMIAANIISEPLYTVPTGYVQVPVCRLLVNLK